MRIGQRADTIEISKRYSFQLIVFAILCRLLMLGSAFAANAPPLMVVPGQSGVSNTGAFTYTIPIAVAPGTAGMIPALSLNYSSQNGDGFEGLGWVLSGLPMITRCPRTLAEDIVGGKGVHGSVNFDANDRYCFEGQRLVMISGTAYGADGSQYRTEIEGFSEIIAHGSGCPSQPPPALYACGPAWFEVHTKAGQIMQLGNTADSQAPLVPVSGSTTGPTGTIRAWAVNRISDPRGNYITIQYDNGSPDTTNGQLYPTEISYTGNTNASTTPYNSVYFYYEARPYATPTYQAGSLLQTTLLLTDVKSYAGLNLVRDYKLSYNLPTSNATNNELASVTLCDGATPTQNCLAPTTFGWQGSRDTLTMTAAPNSIAGGGFVSDTYLPNGLYAGDYNGDGLIDAAIGQYVRCSVATPLYLGAVGYNLGHIPPITMPLDSTDTTFVCVLNGSYYTVGGGESLDLNGDGFSDPITINGALGHAAIHFYQNDTAGHYPNVALLTPQPTIMVGDFNGDGRTDYYNTTASPAYAAYSQGNGSFIQDATRQVGYGYVADFDGDGCSDVLTGTTLTYFCNPAVPSITIPTWANSSFVLGDFNGDGKTDFLVVNSSGATLYLSTGTGLSQGYPINGSSGWGSGYQIITGDFNGDGKTDIALIPTGCRTGQGQPPLPTDMQVWLSTGNGFKQISSANVPNLISSVDYSYCTGTANIYVSALVYDWNNDGAADLWIQKPSGDTEYLFSFAPELMTSVNNGTGRVTNVTYDRLNKNQPLYTKCPGNPSTYSCGDGYPTQGTDGAAYVVSRIDDSNGLGTCTTPGGGTNCYSTTYAYGGAKTDLQGRGFLGFQSITTTDLETNITQTTTYSTAYPLTGLVNTQTRISGSVTLSKTVNAYTTQNLGTSVEGVTRYFVELSQTQVTSNDLNGAQFPNVTTNYTYDCDTGNACAGSSPTGFGNIMTLATCTTMSATYTCGTGDFKRTVANTYSNDTTYWYLGRLITANVESVIVGTSDITRRTSYAYDHSTGVLTTEKIEPNATDNTYLSTAYGYDQFGNRNSATTSTYNNGYGAPRTTTTTYDSLGEFAIQQCNALSQCNNLVYDARFGTPISLSDPNGLTTRWSYDTFGRLATQVRPDGNVLAAAYAYCSGVNGGSDSCPTSGAYAATFTPQNASGTQNGPQSIAYYDMLDRSLGGDMQGFNASWIRTSVVYDALERVLKTSRPYFVSGGIPQYTVNTTMDVLGRVTLATLPNQGTISTVFNGLTVTVTDPNGHATARTKNEQGLVANVTDANGKATVYGYDAEGDLLTVTDPNQNVITNSFSIRGLKTKSVDPDMGTWNYTYDGFGELATQTDAKNQFTTLSYDVLGRVTSRAEASYLSCWVYDEAAHGIGKLYDDFTTTGSSCSSGATTSQTFNYDALSRPAQTTLMFPGSEGTSYPSVYQTAYDSNGRVASVTYPSSFVEKYVYTSLSYTSQIVDGYNGAVVWTVNARDQELHLTQGTAGNSVVTNQAFDPTTGLVQTIQAGSSNAVANFAYGFDKIGNLLSRSDANERVSEVYCYDPLNRLMNSATGTSGATPSTCTSSGTNISDKTISYDALGNITAKSDVGTAYTYGSGAGPHAVTSITGTYLGLSNPVLAYDANGNLTCVSTASGCGGTLGRGASYTSFNMTASLTQGSTLLCLAYDAGHNRISQVVTTASNSCASPGTSAATTTYANDPASGAMEEVSLSGGATTWRDYIAVDGQIVALRTAALAGTPANWGSANWGSFTRSGLSPTGTYLYFTLDHLGSVAVITNQVGSVVERDSYDAWGKRRNPDGTDVTTCSITSGTTRGFTNQEMIDSVCLANLNARLYDPTLGRLLVADPLVPHPFRGQSFNRYAYVENGPLSATDPSGYDDVETVTVTAQNVPSNSDLLYLQHLSASALQTSLPVVEAYRSVASGGMVYSGKASASGLARVLNTADAPRDTIKPVDDDTSDNSDATQGNFYIYGTAGAQPFWCNGQCEWTPTDVGGYWQNSMAGAIFPVEEVDVIASRSTSGTNDTNGAYGGYGSGTVSAYMWYYWATNAFGPRFHSYLEIRNSSGGHFYLSGGPSIRGGGGGNGEVYLGLDAMGLASWDPIYGNLEAWAGSTTSSATYSQASGQWSVPLGTVNLSWSAAQAVLTDEAAAVNSGNITYDAIYENSNSVSFSGARALGLNPSPPANLSVPAWQTNIPLGH